MGDFTVPNAADAEILHRNGLDPTEFAVIHSGADSIVLLCYRTRDTLVIREGDRPWKKCKKPCPVGRRDKADDK